VTGKMIQAPLIFGEVLFDCFEDGSRILGGAPFNVAWHLQAFECKPLLISRVGDDPMGRHIRETMLSWGMSTAGLQLDSAHASGEVKVTLNEGQPSYDILADRAYDHINPRGLPPADCSLIYHGTLALRQPHSAAALDALVDRHKAPVFMDVNLRQPWCSVPETLRLIERSQWVKVNDIELEALVDAAGSLEARAARLLERCGLSWLIVTRGEHGAISVDASGKLTTTQPAADTPVVDTVGAGDAFASVCILGLLKGWPHELTIERAQRFAAVVVGLRGATLNDRAAYNVLLEEWL
jgi:fructokinase